MTNNERTSWIPSPSMNPEVRGRGRAAYVTVDGQELQVSYAPVPNQLPLTGDQTIMFTSNETEFFVVGGDRPPIGEWDKRRHP